MGGAKASQYFYGGAGGMGGLKTSMVGQEEHLKTSMVE